MRVLRRVALATTVALCLAVVYALAGQDPDRVVKGGGISVPGWQGKVDPGSARQGRSIADSKFTSEGNALRFAIGPAAIYWNPANTAKGNYTVKATFREKKVTSSHPHPYGIFIGGSKLNTDQQSLMYCVAYGDGTFLIRRFSGGAVADVATRQPHAAVHKSAADGSVTQEIGWTVKGGRAECAINGTVVAGFDPSEIVGPAKLESTDGVFGLRFSHNVDIVVAGLTLTKN